MESTRGSVLTVLPSVPPQAADRRPSLNRSPLRWQSPAVFPPISLFSLLSLGGPSPNRRVALSPREDQTAAAWPEDHPSPSSHTLFPSHLYSDVHGRVAFVNFGRQAGNQWPSCGEKFILSSASIQGPVV